MLALVATSQRKAVGTVLMCGVVVAIADAWICAKLGQLRERRLGM